ncbi:MAG: ribbon-helix-helix domain-containing protein [bacterium]
MNRFQIYLTSRQARQLGELAQRLHIPKAELIREGIDLLIRKKVAAEEDPLLSLIGQAGRTGHGDISENHNEYLIGRKQVKQNHE